MRFIHILFALSLTGAATRAVAYEEAEWPTEVAACEVYLEHNCNYLLCLCYVGTNPGEKENKLGVDMKAVRRCQQQHHACEIENSMPDAQLDNDYTY